MQPKILCVPFRQLSKIDNMDPRGLVSPLLLPSIGPLSTPTGVVELTSAIYPDPQTNKRNRLCRWCVSRGVRQACTARHLGGGIPVRLRRRSKLNGRKCVTSHKTQTTKIHGYLVEFSCIYRQKRERSHPIK